MKLQVNIQNCYGIGKFDKEFDFSNENMFLIYAQNGIFKTSFAKTLKDIIDGKTPKDNIFNKRMSNANIKIDNNNPTKDNYTTLHSQFPANNKKDCLHQQSFGKFLFSCVTSK